MAIRTLNPIRDDVIADAMGRAVSAAYTCPKRAGTSTGRTGRTGRRYATGDRSNPVNRTAHLIRKSDNPWAIIGPLLAVALTREIKLSGHRLAEAWVDAHEAEAVAEAVENVASVRFARTGDIRAIYDADQEEVRCSLRRMALTLVCETQNVDPRDALK